MMEHFDVNLNSNKV